MFIFAVVDSCWIIYLAFCLRQLQVLMARPPNDVNDEMASCVILFQQMVLQDKPFKSHQNKQYIPPIYHLSIGN